MAVPTVLNRKWIYPFALVCVTLALAARVALVYFYNPNFDGGDMNVVYGVQRLLSGQILYQNPEVHPYAIIQYTPAFYHLSAGICRILHIGPDAVQSIFVVCRWINVLLNILSVLAIAGFVRAMGIDRRTAWIFALPAFIALTHHYFTRIDSLQLFFFTLSLYGLARHAAYRSLPGLVLGAVAAAFCVMSKQSGILIIGIAGWYLLFQRRSFRDTVLFAAIGIFTGLLLFLLWGNGWEAFYNNVYKGVKNGTSLEFLIAMVSSQFFFDIIPLYAVMFLLWKATRQPQAHPAFRLGVMAATASFFFAVLTGFKIGSASNYMTEFNVVTVACIPSLISLIGNRKFFAWKQKTITVAHYALFAFFALMGSKAIGNFSAVFVERWIKNLPEQYAANEGIKYYLEHEGGMRPTDKVLPVDRAFFDNLLLHNATLASTDVIYQTYTGAPGTFNYQPLVDSLSHGAIRFIVNDKTITAPFAQLRRDLPFLTLDSGRYELLKDTLGYQVLRFRE